MAGPVTVTTPVGGTPISSSQFGIPVATNLSVILNPAWIWAYQGTATTSVANTTWTALPFDTEYSGSPDPFGIHSTSTNTTRFTVPTGWAGRWRFTGVVSWTGNATGVRYSCFALNGTQILGTAVGWNASAAVQTGVPATTTLLLTAGQYVEFQAFQNSGGALATVIGSPFTSGCTAEWLGSS